MDACCATCKVWVVVDVRSGIFYEVSGYLDEKEAERRAARLRRCIDPLSDDVAVFCVEPRPRLPAGVKT